MRINRRLASGNAVAHGVLRVAPSGRLIGDSLGTPPPPPPPPPTDPLRAYRTLLLKMDDGSGALGAFDPNVHGIDYSIPGLAANRKFVIPSGTPSELQIVDDTTGPAGKYLQAHVMGSTRLRAPLIAADLYDPNAVDWAWEARVRCGYMRPDTVGAYGTVLAIWGGGGYSLNLVVTGKVDISGNADSSGNMITVAGNNSATDSTLSFFPFNTAHDQPPSSRLANGQWHHIALVHTAANSKFRVYLDGSMVSDGDLVAPNIAQWGSNRFISIGADEDGGNRFYGDIDEVSMIVGIDPTNGTTTYPIINGGNIPTI